MITIDLLQGKGLPSRTRPVTLAVLSVMFILPLIGGLTMTNQYLKNSIELDLLTKSQQKMDTKIAGFSEQVSFRQSADTLLGQTNDCLAESAQAMPRYNQWSSILEAIAQHLPPKFVLDKLVVKSKAKMVHRPQKDNPEQKVKFKVPQRTMRIKISHNDHQLKNAAVQKFIENLQSSSALKRQVETFRLVGHQLETHNDQNVTSYDIDVELKTAY